MDDRKDAPETTSTASASPDDVTFSQFFGTAKDVISRYTHCALCGANLHFSHVTDFSRNLTQETAKCPECGVRARQILHRLQ